VARVQVSPPDKHGYVSLGTSVDATLAAVQTADTVIGVINSNVPRAFGDAMIKMSEIDIFTEDNTPLMKLVSRNPMKLKPQLVNMPRLWLKMVLRFKWGLVLSLMPFYHNWVVIKTWGSIPK
jgi:hypothetical protein